jgi:integrase
MGRARVVRRSRLPSGKWVWDNVRPYKSKQCVFVVVYRLGGRGTRERTLGTWKSRPAAEERRVFADREIAAGRDPRATLASPVRHESFRDAAARLRPQRLTVAPRGIKNHDQAVSHMGKLATIAVGSLTPADFIAWIGTDSSSNSTKLRYLYQYRTILDLCGVDPNPARHRTVKVGDTSPQGQAEEGWVPSYANLQLLLGKLSPRHAAVARFLEGTGLRSVEADNLRRSHIDLETDTLHVFRTKGTQVVPRSVPITSDIRRLLIKEFRLNDLKPSDLVLPVKCGPTGMSMRRHSKLLGLPQSVSPHSLRRRFTSRLGNASVLIPHVSRIIGHKKSSTTLDVYSFPLTDEPAARRRKLRREVMDWVARQGDADDL